MIDFIVTGLPRSGTTWAANWLTTDTTLCIHDPLYKYQIAELDLLKSDKRLGISCTGIWRLPEFLNIHPANKLIIHRDLSEVNDSLKNEMGVPTVTNKESESLDGIYGIHVNFDDLFDPVVAKDIYEWLLEKPFDAERHAYLVELNIQPNFGKLTFDRDALNDFRRKMN
jgi:hypothetical protein